MHRHAGPLHLSAGDVPLVIEKRTKNSGRENEIEPVATTNNLEIMETSVENSVENAFEPVDSLMVDGPSAIVVTSTNSDQTLATHGSNASGNLALLFTISIKF